MTFTSGVPVNGQSLGASKVPIRDNFTKLKTNSEVNHFTVNSANAGKHDFVQMPVRAVPTILASEGALYTVADGSRSELAYTRDATGNEYQLTSTLSSANFTSYFGIAPSGANNGLTFLPGKVSLGGLWLQYGQVTNPGASGSVTFSVPFSAAPYAIFLTLQRTSGDQSVTVSNSTPPTASGFNYLSSSSGSNVLYWMAIGLS